MTRTLSEWKTVENNVDIIENMKNSLNSLLKDCGYHPCKTFLKNVNNGALENKKDIIDKMGGIELYSIMSQTIETTDEQYYVDFVDKINNLIWTVAPMWQHNHVSQERLGLHNDLKNLRDIIISFRKSDENRINRMKELWSEFEYVSRLRNQLPKLSKVVANIMENLLKKYNLYDEYSSYIPVILNTLGSVKGKQYIVVLSTTPSAIYSASVSTYFNSCYDIREDGRCYASSVSYLAQDDKVAVMKVFEDNEVNREKLNMGVGFLSSSKDALARRFVFIHNSKNKDNTILTLGKCYPNANIMDGIFLGKELYSLLIDKDVDKDDLVHHKLEDGGIYRNKISYSKWFRGYEDLLEKGGLTISKSNISENEKELENFDTMVVANKGLYQVDTGLFVKYTGSSRNIGVFSNCDDDEDL
jgi:hypothetical protein